MDLHRLSLGDKGLFERHLRIRRHDLAVYAFPAIYGWKRLFDIRWAIVHSALCVFFRDATGSFLYLPPLGRGVDTRVVRACFEAMDAQNAHAWISRIENVEEADRGAFEELGYRPVPKSHDYVYERASLAGLCGDRFKAKRALVNYFIKNTRFQCVPYSAEYKDRCLELYAGWMAERAAKNRETVYCGMLADSRSCLEAALEEAPRLGLTGLVVEADARVIAFTLGYRLNADTLCVMFEVADLAVKGASQFIFRAFCRENGGYRLINAMDDSGLDNLRRVKQSYRPRMLTAAYIINRSDDRN